MNKSHWNLEQLKNYLPSRKEIKFWIIQEEHVHRRERYFMNEDTPKKTLVTDQDRNVHSRSILLKLFVHLDRPGRQGEIIKKIFPSQPLKSQIDQAIESALQTDHQAWDLPTTIPTAIPHVLTTDPKMGEDIERVMNELTTRIEKSVQKNRATQFNSAELFLSIHHCELHLSTGVKHRSSQSRIYTESAFSYSKRGSKMEVQSDEYLITQWAVHLDHLPLEKIFDTASECAENSLNVVKPLTGKYAVVVDAEVLSNLIHGHLSQLSAHHAYNGLPFIKPGEPFIPNAQGDLLSITLDPTLEFGANTLSISDQGLPQKPLQLVNQNQVIATATDKQFGDYMGTSPTTVRGNIVVNPGNFSHQELVRQAPIVIEVLQFSGLFADPNSGTFSSEIRLAKLYDNQQGTVRYIKGGSLSGSISENFQGLRLSKNCVNRAHFSSESAHGQGYYGPDYALLSDVSIVG